MPEIKVDFGPEELRLAFEGARTGLWAWDVRQQRMLWSSNIGPLLGLPEGTFDDTLESYRSRIHEDDVEAHRQAIAAAFEDPNGLYEIEHRIRWPDGTLRWVEARGKVFRDSEGTPTRLTGTVLDVTDRKDAMTALRTSEAKFATIVRSSPDAIVLSRMSDGVILEANEGLSRLIGIARSEILGKTGEALGLWNAADDRSRLVAALRTHRQVRNIEGILRDREGRPHCCLLSAERIELEGEELMLSVLRDVTDRKEMEDEREALIGELEAANAELERFVYSVSHDLKGPLVTVFGFLGLLEKDLRAGRQDRLLGDLLKIRAGAEAMQGLIEELLEFSRLGRLEIRPEPLDLQDLVGRVVASLSGSLERRRIQVRILGTLPTVEGDSGRLLSLLQNLIDNAAKFLAGRPNPRIEIGARPRQDKVEIFVRDNGPGIPPKDQEKVFELFERLDTSQPGTGLGLALVRRIVEGHGGEVWIESDGETGTAFHFTLPTPD